MLTHSPTSIRYKLDHNPPSKDTSDGHSNMFTELELQRIEQLAAGLSKEEILACFYVKEDELNAADRDSFNRSFMKGRSEAKALAVHHLFSQMGGRDGVKGTLAYLIRFGEQWPLVEEEGSTKDQHVFKVVMPK